LTKFHHGGIARLTDCDNNRRSAKLPANPPILDKVTNEIICS
jgi:hypothetical protein